VVEEIETWDVAGTTCQRITPLKDDAKTTIIQEAFILDFSAAMAVAHYSKSSG